MAVILSEVRPLRRTNESKDQLLFCGFAASHSNNSECNCRSFDFGRFAAFAQDDRVFG
jgi:hypothetical protein